MAGCSGESLVIMQYLEDVFPPPVAPARPLPAGGGRYAHAVRGRLLQPGLRLRNEPGCSRRELFAPVRCASSSGSTIFGEHSPDGDFLFSAFGWAEAVFHAAGFMRFGSSSIHYFSFLPATPFAPVPLARRLPLAHPAPSR